MLFFNTIPENLRNFLKVLQNIKYFLYTAYCDLVNLCNSKSYGSKYPKFGIGVCKTKVLTELLDL